MKKYLPIGVVFIILGVVAYITLFQNSKEENKNQIISIKEFNKINSCAKLPYFLYKERFLKPIIDLSQMHYKGIAFIDLKTKRVIHKKTWERFDALGTYTIDNKGNIYLTPNPFISIKPSTFNIQKAIYKLDSKSATLSRWLVIDEVTPNSKNPYGLISIIFDCDNKTLYASSIDKSNYQEEKGTIFHINPNTKEILEKFKGFDALTLNILKTKNKKFLIAGSARDNGVYLNEIKNGKLSKKFIKIFEIPNPTLRVRKIKIINKNQLLIEAIKFNYSLIAQTTKKQRKIFIATYNPNSNNWKIEKK